MTALCGCKSFHSSRFYVSRITASAESTIQTLEKDREQVAEALDQLAKAQQLERQTNSYGNPNLIRRFLKPGANPILITATAGGRFVYVDVEQLRPGIRHDPDFEALVRSVDEELRQRFGYRVKGTRKR